MSAQHPSADPAGEVPPSLRDAGAFDRTDAVPMRPSPIRPAWIRSGKPVTRCGDHSTALDNFACTAVWDCTRSTFEWHYTMDETVYILEGEVRVTDALGQTHTLTAGSIGYFPAHSTWFWEVDRYVRKVAFLRREVPFGLRLATRVLARINLDGRLRRWLRGRAASPRLMRLLRVRPSSAALVLMSLSL